MCRCSLAFVLLFFISGCDIFKTNDKKQSQKVGKLKESITLTKDPEKGKAVYYANCIPCHNNDPKKQGTIGPQIYGASKELLFKKINYGEYPKNYTPKRSTKIMPLMPHLHKGISNLHAFLNEPT